MLTTHDAIRAHLLDPVVREKITAHRNKLNMLSRLLDEPVLTEQENTKAEVAPKKALWED